MGIDLMEYAAMKSGNTDAVCAFEDPFDCAEKKMEFRLADEMLGNQQKGIMGNPSGPGQILGMKKPGGGVRKQIMKHEINEIREDRNK